MSIDLPRAFTYVAEDPHWLPKLLLTALYFAVVQIFLGVPLLIVALILIPDQSVQELSQLLPQLQTLSNFTFDNTPTIYLLFVPVTIGLVCAAALMGYYIELVRRVRIGVENPLPQWTNYPQFIRQGGGMLIGYVGYLLAALFLYALGLVIINLLSGTLDDMTVVILALCCNLPLLLIYVLSVIFLTSICVLPYSETNRVTDYYNLRWVWRRLRRDTRLTLLWFFNGTLANFGFSAVQSIPMLGILLTFTLTIPVQGHLLGQYAAALDQYTGETPG